MMMILQPTSLALSLLLVVHSVSAGLFSRQEPSAAERINDYLVAHLPGDQNLKRNFDVASKWKQELIMQDHFDQDIIGGLACLEDLFEILKDPPCDEKMYSSVEESLQLFGNKKAYSREHKSGVHRTQYIVRIVALSVSQTCHEQNKVLLDSRLRRLDAGMIERAKNLLKFASGEGLLSYGRDICLADAHKAKKSDLSDMLLAILDRMSSSQNSDFKYLRPIVNERGQKTVKEDKVRELVGEYIMTPCRYLEKELGTVIGLANLDTMFHAVSDPEWLQRISSPFRYLIPTSCLCDYFDALGEDTIAKQVIALVPKANDKW